MEVGMGQVKVAINPSEERRREDTMQPSTADFNTRQFNLNKNVLIRNVNIAKTSYPTPK